MGVTDGSSLRSVTFYGINERSQGPPRKAHALGVEPNSRGLLQETGTWRTISASQEERLKRVGR